MAALNYTLLTPPKIVFGWGRRAEVGSIAAPLGQRAFLVSGSQTLQRTGVIDQIVADLQAHQIEVRVTQAAGREPEVADVDTLTAEWRALQPTAADFVIALGGGSTIDLAKASAAMVTQKSSSSVVDYLEGVGRGLTLQNDPLPLLAMPTTAGTGSEATKNAVISSYAPMFKKSLRSDKMMPRVVLIDPELTVSVPPEVTAYTGMDTITQLIESYISRKAAPIPQALCIQGLQLAIPALPLAYRDGNNRSAREAMSHAALLSGIALANSGLGVAHGVAAGLGTLAKVPHGLACAMMLGPALRINQSVRQSAIAELGRTVMKPSTGEEAALAQTFISQIEDLCDQLHIPQRLRDLGVTQEQFPELTALSQGNSLSGNPRELSPDELLSILKDLW